MGLVTAYVLAVVVGLAGGSWEAVRLHRQHPALRDRPPSWKRATAVGCFAAAVFASLAWVLGEWNGVYLAGAGTFGAALVVSWPVWPLLRSARRAPGSFG